MEHLDNSKRCKWSRSATNLLVSIWSHDIVQKQLKLSTRNQPLWESIARFMTRKGHPVTGLQCRTRIKNMLCTYQEACKKNNPSVMMSYYDIFKEVLDKKNVRENKSAKIVQYTNSKEIEEDNENSEASNLTEIEPTRTDNECEMEFLEETNDDSQLFDKTNNFEEIKDMQIAIVRAIDTQTKAIIKAIELQSQMIERIIKADREKLECILKLEKESRKQLKKHLDKLGTKFVPESYTNSPMKLN